MKIPARPWPSKYGASKSTRFSGRKGQVASGNCKPLPLSIRALALVLSGWGAVNVLHADGTWIELEPLPQARQELPAVLLDGCIYAAGGMMNFSATAVNRFERYDIRSNRWQRLRDLPLAVHHTALAAVGKRIYLMGGATGTSTPNGRVFEYDPSTDTWLEKAPLLQATWAAAAVTYQQRIYLFSGTAASDFSSHSGVPHTQVYTVASNSWSTNAAPIPLPRNHISALRIGTQVYVSPGRTANPADQADRRLHRYDLVHDMWTELAPLPEFYRSGSAMAQVNGVLYLIGGEGSALVLNKVHAYDPRSNSWHRVMDLPEGRHGMGAVSVGNIIYVPGGGFQNGIGPSARVFAFVVDQSSPLPYELWARGFFSSLDARSGPEDDFDGDGLTNFEEFALNLDAGTISETPRPQLHHETDNRFFLEFARGHDRAAQWNLLLSSDLFDWTNAVREIDWTELPGVELGLGTERARFEGFARGREHLFLRVLPSAP